MNALYLRFGHFDGSKVALFVIGILTFCIICETANAAPPARRKPSGEQPSSASKDSVSKKDDAPKEQNSSKESGASKRRAQETNDGALPESENFVFELDERANNIENWAEPDIAQELRSSVLKIAKQRHDNWPDFGNIDEKKAGELGIRVIKSSKGQIVLYTDLPKQAAVDEIAQALEEAIPHVLQFFQLDEEYFEKDRHIEAFLMRDVNSFISIGALDGPPRFLYGYSMGNRIYAKDQKVEYYNRFLLVHELVHTLMHEVFGDLRPRWYSEGTAEYLALHKWYPDTNSISLALIPESDDFAPGFGRLQQIQQLVKSKEVPTLYEILNFQPRDFVNVSTYSWSWAFTMFLYRTPKYKNIVKALPYWSIVEDPNKLFVDAIGERWCELENEWADFIGRIEFDYDFEAAMISEADDVQAQGEDEGVVTIAATRGWQKTGLFLTADTPYKLAAKGKYNIYLHEYRTDRDFEAPGATFTYLNGVPLGRLEVVVVPKVEELDFYQTYGLASDNAQGSRGGDGFRFDAFRNEARRERRTRYTGEDFTEPADKEVEQQTTKNGVQTSASKNKQGQERNVSNYSYNALFPWNEAQGFNNSTLTYRPRYSGELYMRINTYPSLLGHNKGAVKVQIKKQNLSDD